MIFSELINKKNITMYRVSSLSGIPYTTINDICNGKTKLEKCSAETIYKLAKTLNVDMEFLTELGIQETMREHSYEHALHDYLQHDLNAYKEGLKNKSSTLDCLWGELYGSIKAAEINDGSISHEHAEYLRTKYLWS